MWCEIDLSYTGILGSSVQLICTIEVHLHTKDEDEGYRNWNMYDNYF